MRFDEIVRRTIEVMAEAEWAAEMNNRRLDVLDDPARESDQRSSFQRPLHDRDPENSSR